VDAGWALREKAWRTEDRLREKAWDAEERVLWRGSDATRAATERALKATAPLQRLVQTKLTWPAGDALKHSGTAARSAIATAAVVAVAGAGAAGVVMLEDGAGDSGSAAALVSAPAAGTSPAQTLSGVPVEFERTSSSADADAASTPVAAQAEPPGGKPGAEPKAHPANVAWDFAQAFVQYEVGNADEGVATAFSELADAPLAEALGADPPRLPKDQQVPEAKVLNVVLGERQGEELQVSVSLVRLQAASELRLTLRHTPEGWLVAKVLG
jgi:hypothetical protein